MQRSEQAEEALFFSEDSMSDHGLEIKTESHVKQHLYLTTNLVTNLNITLADVITEEITKKDISKRVAW